jgi:hypothetical protein
MYLLISVGLVGLLVITLAEQALADNVLLALELDHHVTLYVG